jgi:hypothetical protein
MLFCRYARPFWLDIHNFDKKRYKPLPEVAAHASRSERAQKRQRT